MAPRAQARQMWHGASGGGLGLVIHKKEGA